MSAAPANRQGGYQVGPYVFGKTLGTGATGTVKLAQHVETKEVVAIKIVRKDFLLKKPSLKRKLKREITVMKLCDHPNVLKLYDVFEIETHLFLVIEYVDGCELFDYLVKRQFLPPSEALPFFHQIIAGLEYCHKRLICHRDLKPENLLLDRNLNIKIADFGMTSLNPPGSFLETSCGSPHYAAPEVVSGEMYNGLEADIWSVGVILYAMLTGRLPFDDENISKVLSKVQRGVYYVPRDVSSECMHLVKAMLTVDPSERITIAGIKADPWYQSAALPVSQEDSFDLPSEPIAEPDPEVLQGLVDLGWGSAEKITNDLLETTSNLEKVFYNQLSRHPMFQRRKGTDGGAPSLVTADLPKKKPSAATDSWLPPEWRVHYDKNKQEIEAKKESSGGAPATTGSSTSDTPEKVVSDVPTQQQAAGQDESAEPKVYGLNNSAALEKSEAKETTATLPPHVLATFSKMTDASATVAVMKKSVSQLVRQSDIVTRSTPQGSLAVEKAGSHHGEEKSWFGRFASVLSSDRPRNNSHG